MVQTNYEVNNPIDWEDVRKRTVKLIQSRISSGEYAEPGTYSKAAPPEPQGITPEILAKLDKEQLEWCLSRVRYDHEDKLKLWADVFGVASE